MRRVEQEMGGFKVVMLLSLAALIQTPMAQQEVCEPKSAGVVHRQQPAPSLCCHWVRLHWCKLLF